LDILEEKEISLITKILLDWIHYFIQTQQKPAAVAALSFLEKINENDQQLEQIEKEIHSLP